MYHFLDIMKDMKIGYKTPFTNVCYIGLINGAMTDDNFTLFHVWTLYARHGRPGDSHLGLPFFLWPTKLVIIGLEP